MCKKIIVCVCLSLLSSGGAACLAVEATNPLLTPPSMGESTLSFPGETIDMWHGYKRHRFNVDGCHAWVVEPAKPLPGKPWSWCLQFPDAFTDRTPVPGLLAAGYHHAHIDVGNTFGSPAAIKHFNAFYDTLTRAGLSNKVVLVGLSRGGLYAYRWACENPGKVSLIYGDAPVCDMKSWPGGKGKGKGSKPDWAAAMKCYGFKEEAEALAYPANPIDTLAPLAKAGVPLIHVVGDADDIVPVPENTAIIEERYKKLGGVIEVIHKTRVGHHPHVWTIRSPSSISSFSMLPPRVPLTKRPRTAPPP